MTNTHVWLLRVPASFFGMVLGLVGAGSNWRAARAATILESSTE